MSREVESCCFPSPWEGEAARYIHIPGFTGAFLDWRHQPPVLLCFPHRLLCVSPKAYLKRSLNLIWPEIFLAVCKLCWISVYPFYFQDMPTLLICVPDLLFPPVSFFHPAVIDQCSLLGESKKRTSGRNTPACVPLGLSKSRLGRGL